MSMIDEAFFLLFRLFVFAFSLEGGDGGGRAGTKSYPLVISTREMSEMVKQDGEVRRSNKTMKQER